MSRHSLIGMVAALAGTAALAGCGGSSNPGNPVTASSTTSTRASTTRSTTTTPASGTASVSRLEAARMYVHAVEPVNAAGAAFAVKIKDWTLSTPQAKAESEAKPYTQALVKLRPELASLARSYPPVAPDVDRLLAAFGPLVTDLKGVRDKPFDPQGWAQTVVADASSVNPVAARLRATLGLPRGIPG